MTTESLKIRKTVGRFRRNRRVYASIWRSRRDRPTFFDDGVVTSIIPLYYFSVSSVVKSNDVERKG